MVRLKFLLEHTHSFENCSDLLAETAKLFNEPEGWFFRLLNKTIQAAIDEPDMFYGVSEAIPSLALDAISLAGLHGLAAIELSDQAELQMAAKELSSSTHT